MVRGIRDDMLSDVSNVGAAFSYDEGIQESGSRDFEENEMHRGRTEAIPGRA